MRQRWQRALITGASAGIGAAFARELAAQGTDLVLVARRKELLEEVADEVMESFGVNAEVIVADLTERNQLAEVEVRLGDEDAPIDLLVNNAGGGEPGAGRFVRHDRDLIENQAMLNAVSVLRLTHAAVGAMTQRGRGNVIQVSAGVAFYPTPGGATYAASKAFVNSFSQAVGLELEKTGVRITTVCPGFTRTDGPKRNGFSEKNIPSWWWTDPEVVVRDALEGARRGKAVVSPTWVNKFNARFGAHFPNVMSKRARKLVSMGAKRSSGPQGTEDLK